MRIAIMTIALMNDNSNHNANNKNNNNDNNSNCKQSKQRCFFLGAKEPAACHCSWACPCQLPVCVKRPKWL